MKTQVECAECNSIATVVHSMDKDHYTVSYCNFCGSYLGDEEPELEFSEEPDSE